MFPTGILKSADVGLLIFYFSILGLLLIAGIILRVKFKIFKMFYIPASLIGGAIGLVLGSGVLGVIPEDMTTTFSALPSTLIVIFFAPVLMCQEFGGGGSIKEMKDIAVPQLIAGSVGSFMQMGIPCLMTAILLTPVFGVNQLFSSIVEISWSGGPGTAAGMAEVFQNLAWPEGTGISLTSATIGLITGIVSGVIMVNHAARKGYLSPKNNSITVNLETAANGLNGNVKNNANAYSTISNTVVESFAFHAALIGVAIVIGYIIKYLLGFLIDGLPLFPLAMIGGLVVNRILKALGLMKYVDENTLHRLQGLSLDFLVVAATASIKLQAIADNFLPILIISVATLLSMLFFFYWICPRLFHEDWFEQGIVHYGGYTGVTATGFMLLRMVDPEMKTISSSAYAIQAPVMSPLFGMVTSMLPYLVFSHGNIKIGIIGMGLSVLCIVLAKIFGCWHKPQRAVKAVECESL